MSERCLTPEHDHLIELLAIVGVGTWDWELPTGRVMYSDAWANILGYTVDELEPVVDTWERMVLPEDLTYANQQIQRYLDGEVPVYEAEFRMVCRDGSIIWAQDKGRVTEYAADGTPVRFMGVLQNVSRLKDAELRLRENQETLDLAVQVSGLGTWDWDIAGNVIHYNDEYLQMLGYTQEERTGSLEEWEAMNHPEDLPVTMERLNAYLEGRAPDYQSETRMRHRDGTYIWTRDVGKVVARDSQGRPTRLIGGHLNIDGLKAYQAQLTAALSALEHNNLDLERQVELRTQELVEQDRVLSTVNQISRKLLFFQPEDSFNSLVDDCLRQLGEVLGRNRVYIWKNRTGEDGRVRCTQIYEWVEGAVPIQGNEIYEEIPYDALPNFLHAINSSACLNSRICDLSTTEREVLEPQGIRTILIAPVTINDRCWGFIGVDNCEDEELFTTAEESLLLMSGSMLASAIERMETEAELREVEERTQLMLNATPLCCNLWTTDFRNMNCNEEAVRLFDLSSQEEYLERFYQLSPEYQPCGRRSDELAADYVSQAFREGYCRFEWLHQKLDGTPIPAEITLVRIKYKDGFIVAGYTRDLREFKTMLAQLQAQEDDLRTARDEALLSSKAKSNFLANMSHEIRTPMNAISGLAEIILRETESETTVEYARGIKAACSSLLNIINDILDISKIESGKLEIFNAPYELASLLNDVITISRMRLGDKPLMFITDIDSRLPGKLVGDELRVKQILINLLSNAIKFTQSGYIALRVTGTLEGDWATLHFSVRDSGIGIQPSDLNRLFVEFERVNTTKNRNIEGTGLGLAISKQLCEMMNGYISVNSTYGEGSEFVVALPQACPEYRPLAQVEKPQTVLLYEPRERYRRSIAESLENLGCRCIPCENQSELYENLDAMPYGYLLTAALHLGKVRRIVERNRMPVQVAAFANYGETVEERSVYTMLFPVNCLQLADLLNGRTEELGFSGDPSSGPSFTAPTARILVVDDNPVNLRVAQGLMKSYGFVIDTAENGLEAVELVQKHHYDMVFMDHMMPEMDGIDATIAIRQLEGDYYRQLPIVALTANALVGTREMFIREGMNDFLAKPIEINKLGHVLLKWLPQGKVIKSRSREKLAAGPVAPLLIEGVDTVSGILSVGGDRDDYLHILTTYHADGLQKCNSLLHHLSARDLASFRTEVHALKSTSATIGAMELSTLAARMEEAAQNGDTLWIDGHIDELILLLQALLEAIRPVLPEAVCICAERQGGDPKILRDALTALRDAAELASIAQLEAQLDRLEGFSWPQETLSALEEIRRCLAVFDYDGVLDRLEQMGSQGL